MAHDERYLMNISIGIDLEKQNSIIARFEYCGVKLTFSLFFLFLGICFGIGLLFLVDSGEKWFGLFFVFGASGRFYEQILTRSIILYKNKIVRNRYLFKPIILDIDEIKGNMTFGVFGGMLTLQVKKNLLPTQISFELGLLDEIDRELLKSSLKKLNIIIPKFN